MMNGTVSPELKQKISTLCSEIFGTVADSTVSYTELLALWQELHGIYLETTAINLQQWAEKNDQLSAAQSEFDDRIEADAITVEIIDKNTGKIYRRDLPVNYLETANGLVLSGETFEGKPSQINFLSEAALAKINDLLGKGPDAPRCDEK